MDDYDINRNDPIQRPMVESNEYQLKLDCDLFVDKMDGVEVLQRIASQFLGPYISSVDEHTEQYWYELQYEKDGCGADYSELRTRTYITGKHAGTT